MYFKDFTTSSNNFNYFWEDFTAILEFIDILDSTDILDSIDVLDFIENEYVYEEEVLKANKDLEVEIQELQLDNLD